MIYEYVLLLVTNIIAASSILFPLPAALLYTTALLLGLNPILIVIISALGSTIGEFVSYYIGVFGSNIVKKKIRKKAKIMNKIRKQFKKRQALVIITWGALPTPFDFLAIYLGTIRYNILKFFIYGLIGKTIRFTIYVIIAKFSITWLSAFI